MDNYDRVKQFKADFTAPPKAVPDGDVDVSGNGRWRIWQYAGTKIDAPILGNGDMLAAFAGPCEYPQFWITSNDFWQMESNPNWVFFHDNDTAAVDPAVTIGGPRPVGRLVLSIPALKDADYHVEQHFAEAMTEARYDCGEKGSFLLCSFVSAGENLLILKLTSRMKHAVDIKAFFRFPDETGLGCDKGVNLSGRNDCGVNLQGSVVGLMDGNPVQVQKTEDGVLYGYREFSDHVDVPVKAGFAGAFVKKENQKSDSLQDSSKEVSDPAVDAAGSFRQCANDNGSDKQIQLMYGESRYYVFALRTWDKVSRPMEMARSRAAWMTEQDICEQEKLHLSWWRSFWNTSGVTLDDPLMEQRYDLSQYVMASVSRDLDYPPNILGICTFDRPAWNANYKINYNHQSSYLGLLASGHFAQADPHDAPYFAMMDIGREMSRRLLGHNGTYLPLGLGPKGMVSEALLLHMKSQAVHGATNMMMRYALTLDEEYGRKIYPYLESLADFWEADLVEEDGVYHIRGDSMHERVDKDVQEHGESWDPVNSLGYLKTFFAFMPEISRDLGVDDDRRAHWKKIADNLAAFPSGTLREIRDNPTLWAEADVPLERLVPEKWMDVPVFYDEGRGGKWSYHFPGNIMQIYPAGAIGLGSDPELLQTAWNTVHVHALIEDSMAAYRKDHDTGADDLDNEKGNNDPHFRKAGAWNSTNLSCLFFPAAVRVGYDPEVIWKELEDRIVHRGLPNGFIDRNPHGIENLSTVPNTIQEMMLLSHEGVIRVFRVWPKKSHPDAGFHDLWAVGGFQVSASLVHGEVSEVLVRSHKGRTLVMENPWTDASVSVFHVQKRERESLSGTCVTIDTFPGEELKIVRGV
ncbi:MAG: glycosyl hydrolase family 95 catalytic domain-containing protein [Bilifractor sp.]